MRDRHRRAIKARPPDGPRRIRPRADQPSALASRHCERSDAIQRRLRLLAMTLTVEQLQKAGGSKKISFAALQRLLRFGVRPPLLQLRALVDADGVPRLLGR